MILLDTHVWLWWLLGDGNLKRGERQALDRLAAEGRIALSWVSLWETELLERKKRIALLPDLCTWIESATRPGVCTILDVDLAVILAQRELPADFHPDPADRLITATARLSGYALATKDRRIIESKACKIYPV